MKPRGISKLEEEEGKGKKNKRGRRETRRSSSGDGLIDGT